MSSSTISIAWIIVPLLGCVGLIAYVFYDEGKYGGLRFLKNVGYIFLLVMLSFLILVLKKLLA